MSEPQIILVETKNEAQRLITELHAKHQNDDVECLWCGELSNGVKIDDSLDCFTLVTNCCSEGNDKFPFIKWKSQ